MSNPYEYLDEYLETLLRRPTDRQREAMARVRAAAKAYGDVLEAELPDGPDKTFTIRYHRSSAMWAIACIVRQPDGVPRS